MMQHVSEFFFPPGAKWTWLTEVRLKDREGQSAGNIDLVLIEYDNEGRIIDFGALEVQAVYISGNVRRPFTAYMSDPVKNAQMDWTNESFYPRPDYLSSSRKRLAPQLLYKGGILHTWQKKQAVALHRRFFERLPTLPRVSREEAEMAWLVYELPLNTDTNTRHLTLQEIVYTRFEPALLRITAPETGSMDDFLDHLQGRFKQTEEKFE